MRCLNVLFAAAFLAACQEPAPANQAAQAPAPSQSTPSEPVRLGAIPAAFHGVWAATPADCAAPAESRMEIGAERLTFYESTGSVASVERTGPDEILITVPLTGEGARSLRTYRYRLLNQGSSLFDVRSGFTRRRCSTA